MGRPKIAPRPVAAPIPPMVAASGPHPSAATINGSGAKYSSNREISAPEMIEANISADAQPAAMAMRTIMVISCPAPFERLEIPLRTPTIGDRTTRKPYELEPAAQGRRL